MSAAQVTEAHIARARASGYTTDNGVQMAAQFIANNEAAKAERDQLRAQNDQFSENLSAVGAAYNAEKARAERAEAEVKRLKSDGAASAFVAMACRASRAETDRNNLRADLAAVKSILAEEKDRAERAEAELAKERARLDYLSTRGFEHRHHETGDHLGYEWTISNYSESEDVTLRDVIDAEMREDEK